MKIELEKKIVKALVCAELAGTNIVLQPKELRALIDSLYLARARLIDSSWCPNCENYTHWKISAADHQIVLLRCPGCGTLWTSTGVQVHDPI